jgi:polyhydroxyalkanoate synthesis regulator phasin
MSNPIDEWTHRLRDLTGTSDSDPEEARRFVTDLYRAAQADQDEVRAEAEFEREE